MCCATPWPSTRSMRAVYISAPAVDRCTPRPTPETTGLPSCEICRPCCPSRCRHCHDLGKPNPFAPVPAREGRTLVPLSVSETGEGRGLFMIRVVLPAHLRKLARVDREVQLDVTGQVTQRTVLDALEARYPMLRGTIRDQVTQQRRPFVRFFACEEDLSHEAPDAPLPNAVAPGPEPFLIIGAMAGG